MKKFDEAMYPGWNDRLHYPALTVGHAACLLSRVHPLAYEGKGYDDLPASVKGKGDVILGAIRKRELLPEVLYVARDGRLTPIESNQLLPGDSIAYDTTLASESFAKWCAAHGYEHPWQFGTHAIEEKPLAKRERTSLLAVIRILAVMAKADGRGAAVAVEKQLQELGFNSPKEHVIRDILKRANELEP